VTGCAVHISDLHRGTTETVELDEALVALCADLEPELVIVSGDLSNRGRLAELTRAKELLDRLPAPVLAVPGNHDIPYTFPARVTRPWERFEQVFGTTEPVVHTAHAVACGLNSVRPWRHQGGRLGERSLATVAPALGSGPPGALRVVVLHHHLAGAPWRASRKLPLARRGAALHRLAAAGAELVLGGHIHQSSAAERRAFEALPRGADGTLLLSTAPGFGRPRPHRLGEAQGLHVIRWDASEVTVETRIWSGSGFSPTVEVRAPRR
jgi:3',5'-cyclic AMP phosphodiesterase CpdA